MDREMFHEQYGDGTHNLQSGYITLPATSFPAQLTPHATQTVPQRQLQCWGKGNTGELTTCAKWTDDDFDTTGDLINDTYSLVGL